MTALGVGLVGSVSAPPALMTLSAEETPPKSQTATVPYTRSRVVYSDSTAVVETSAGKVCGFERLSQFGVFELSKLLVPDDSTANL